MDEKRFWDIISVGCPKEPGASWVDALSAQVVRLPLEEIDSFAQLLTSKLRAACTFDLRAVASLVMLNQDYEFLCFCNWLVGMGKSVYEAALRNPDSLLERLHAEDDFMADLDWITRGAWTKATGKNQYSRGDRLEPTIEELAGDRWDIADRSEWRRRFPQLAAWHFASEEVDE
jgi:hypothetical protein